MTRKARIWMVGSAIFSAANFVGAGFAIAAREGMHSSIHLGLAVLSAGLAWMIAARARAQTLPDTATPATALPGDRMEYLQQSVDSIAIELERISEAQRYEQKLREQRGDAPPPPPPKRLDE